MKLQTIGSIVLFSLLAALSGDDFLFIISAQAKISSPQFLAQNPAGRKAEADRLFKEGEQQAQTSQFEAAIQSLQQALNIYRELKDRSSEAKTLTRLVSPYAIRGDYAKAIEFCQQSLAIAREIADRSTEQRALTNLGSVYGALGEYAKAIEHYQQSLAIARETSNPLNEGGVLINLGVIYGTLGDYAKAIEYYQQSLAIMREISSSYGERLALGNLGVACRNLGDFAKAIEYGQQALAIARQTKDRQGEASGIGDLGTAYNSLSDYAKAIQYLKQSLAIAREVSDRRGEVIALDNLGFALYKQGNFLAAEQTLFEGIKVLESLRSGLDRNSKVSILDTQAHIYQLLQQVLIAQNKTQEALEIAERGRARAFVELLAARLAPSASAQITINPPNIQQIQQIAKEQNATLVEYSTIKNEALYIWVIKPTCEITFRSVDLKSLNINLGQATESTRVAAATGRGLNEQGAGSPTISGKNIQSRKPAPTPPTIQMYR
ncbi:tetratricopeptide repeat protein [Microcoleus sp. F6_B4]